MIDPEKVAEIIAGIKIGDKPARRQEPGEPNLAVDAIIAGMDLTPKPELTQSRLKELLDYNPETGLFTWKSRPSHNGGIKVGDVAGSVTTEKGKHTKYIDIMIRGKSYQAHNLIWLYVYGRFPARTLDHIDRDGTNNRLANLIEADMSIQAFNSRLSRSNTSGHRGVSWRIENCKWLAVIGGGATRKHLGLFNTFEEAVAARQAAEIKKFGCLVSELNNRENRQPKLLRRL